MSLEYKIEVSGNASIARYRCCTSTGCHVFLPMQLYTKEGRDFVPHLTSRHRRRKSSGFRLQIQRQQKG